MSAEEILTPLAMVLSAWIGVHFGRRLRREGDVRPSLREDARTVWNGTRITGDAGVGHLLADLAIIADFFERHVRLFASQSETCAFLLQHYRQLFVSPTASCYRPEDALRRELLGFVSILRQCIRETSDGCERRARMSGWWWRKSDDPEM